MNQDITRDLTWWRMARWTPIMFRVVATAILPVPCLGLVLGLVSGPIIGVAAALVLSALIFAIGLAFRHTSRRPQQLGRIRWEGVVRGRNLALGLFAGLAFGLAFGLTLGPTTGVAVGFAIGMSTWLQMGLAMTTRRSSADDDEPLDPLTCWRRDRRFWLVFGMMVGLAVGLAVGFTVDLPTGLAFGFMSALGFGILSGSTWPATLTFIHLWRAGVAPLRMLRFLEDARRRQVLRTVGPLYQFRHARLQDRLAADFLRPHHHAPANDRPGDRQPVA